MSIRAIIVDDEELARENLEMLLQSFCPQVAVIAKGRDKEEAKELIEAHQPDVVFLDICMPSGTEGLTLLDEIKNKNFLVVFVTAFKEYAIKAFNANAVHYLLKPIDVEELIDAVNKLEERLQVVSNSSENRESYNESIEEVSNAIRTGVQNKITIAHTKGIKIIDQKDIVFVKADSNCSVLYFKDGTKYTDTRTLKTYESVLNNDMFYRVHKSYITNVNCIKEVISADGGYVLLNNGMEIPVSRRRLQAFKELIKSIG